MIDEGGQARRSGKGEGAGETQAEGVCVRGATEWVPVPRRGDGEAVADAGPGPHGNAETRCGTAGMFVPLHRQRSDAIFNSIVEFQCS